MHALILPTSRHGLSLQIQFFSFRMSHVSNMRVQITSNHHAASRRCGMHHLVRPIIQLVCRPVSKVGDRAQLPRGPTSTFLPLWHLPCPVRQLVERHFTDLPGFANVQFDCNNETWMSICPSSHPAAPLEKSVSSQHTVSHRRTMSTRSFGTGQENHVVCLRISSNLHSCRVLAVSGLQVQICSTVLKKDHEDIDSTPNDEA